MKELGQVSLVIPVFNQLHFTKQCIDSLLKDTDRPSYEIVLVDNASSDGTKNYLLEKQKELSSTKDRLELIFNDTNRGVAPAWNQGLRKAQGQQIGILNNDILVSNGWMKNLLWALEYHQLGLVCPFAANGELVYDFKSRAVSFAKKNRKKLWSDFDFSAVLMPRTTLESVGYFDEGFLVGGYEDTDYCYRLQEKGLRYGVSGAAFIHHFGSQTLGEFKKRGDKHASHNRAYFIQKWKKDPSEGVASIRTKLHRTWRNIKMFWDYM